MSVIVQTAYGKLQGEEHDGISVFRGVPFAAPPFGSRRFRPPQRPEAWAGTRAALKAGPIAPQPTFAEFEFGPGRPGEDCLNLNIWTPEPGGRGLPVMVFAHGGGQVVGTASDPLYDGMNLAKEGVVVVTNNRRLGAEGFLYLGEFFDDERGTGNFGLLDQIEALRWVQENIEAFGGDPGNVTLFGESGGGSATNAVLSMQASRGLVHRAISQSPGDDVLSPEIASQATRHMLELVGVAPGDWDALLATPWERFADVFPEILAVSYDGAIAYVPTLGELLPTHPSDAIPGGAAQDVSLMIGSNRDEERLFEVLTVNDEQYDPGLANYEKRLRDAGSSLEVALEAYAKARPELDPASVQCALIGDMRFRVNSIKIADGHSLHTPGKTFMYLFGWESPQLGAAHALDLMPLFGSYEHSFSQMGGEKPHVAIDRTMTRAWTAFARSGDPSTSELAWPAYDCAHRLTMELDEVSRVLEDPFSIERTGLGRLLD